MFRIAAALLLTLWAGPAWAGCDDFRSGVSFHGGTPAPVVEICYEGQCEQTTPIYLCWRYDLGFAEYRNGWYAEAGPAAGLNPVRYKGEAVPPDAVSCNLVVDTLSGVGCLF